MDVDSGEYGEFLNSGHIDFFFLVFKGNPLRVNKIDFHQQKKNHNLENAVTSMV